MGHKDKTADDGSPLEIRSSEDSFRLARFIALLVLDRDRLRGVVFLHNLERYMAAAELTDEERGYLRAGNFRDLCQYLAKVAGIGPGAPIVDDGTGG